MLIRMTGIGTAIVSVFTAGLVAAGSLLGSGSSTHDTRTALVIDAALARDGRDLVAPRLRALDAELRLPRRLPRPAPTCATSPRRATA